MITAFVQFGDSASGLSSLGVDGQTFIIQLITFILAILVLRKWAVKPILKVMNERRTTIEQGVKLGEQLQKEQAELEQKVAQTLHEARSQADEVIAAAQDRGRQVVAEAEDKAHAKAEALVAAAEDRIKQDTARTRQKLEAELAGLVADATEVIIDEKVDAKKDAGLIDRALKQRETA